jgi:hypothetical protein
MCFPRLHVGRPFELETSAFAFFQIEIAHEDVGRAKGIHGPAENPEVRLWIWADLPGACPMFLRAFSYSSNPDPRLS